MILNIYSWRWRLHQLGSVDAESCPTDRLVMLHCSTPATYYPAADTNCGVQSNRVLLHSSFLDWTIVTAFCLDFLPTSSSSSNAAAHLFFRIRRSEHITHTLISLHWLRVPERISFKLAVLTYRYINDSSPSYLQSCFTRVADMTSRRRLRSFASHRLEVPSVRLSTVGKRAFPVAGANTWNDLPLHVTSSGSASRLSFFLVPTRTSWYNSVIIINYHCFFSIFWHFLWNMQ